MRHFSAFLVSLSVLFAGSLFAVSGARADDPDIGVSRQAICCGTSCCLIDGVCLSRGETNPTNSCEECNPSVAGQTAWSAIPGCVPTDAGPVTMDAGPIASPDAGASDAGPLASTAAGPTGTDAGPTGGDSGTAPMDSGTSSGTDAGTTPPADDGGCAASPSPRGRGALALGLVAFAALVFARRRG